MFFSRTDQSFLGQWWWTVDRILLGCFILLSVIGLALVATAGSSVATRIGANPGIFFVKHLIVLIPSLIMMIGVSMCDLKTVRRIAVAGFGVMIILMVLVLFIGDEIKGATRWIGLGPFSLQPSEIAKPCFIVVSAWLMSRAKEVESFKGTVYALGVYLCFVGLLIAQPDIGMTMVVSATFVTLLVLAGLGLRWVIGLGMAGVGALVLFYFTLPHFRDRMDRFLNPENADTYQVDRALLAFQNGGMWGTGIAQGVVKTTIPDSHADFIFAVLGEELGVFSIVLIVLYGFILMRGYNRTMDTDNLFIILAAGGLLTLFGLQAFINMGSTVNLLPTKGMTLPFISYGGSSLLSMGLGMGMLLALTKRQGRSGIARGGLSIRPYGRGDKEKI